MEASEEMDTPKSFGLAMDFHIEMFIPDDV
jgi:hypothetical protein